MDAELRYLFRHVLLRDAAYQLQLPSDRARLHALAISIIESALLPSVTDPRSLALELADHARLAQLVENPDVSLGNTEARYLEQAIEYQRDQWQPMTVVSLCERLAAHGCATREQQAFASCIRVQELAPIDPTLAEQGALVALEQAGADNRARAILLYALARARKFNGNAQSAQAPMHECLKLLETLANKHDLVDANLELASNMLALGDASGAAQLLEALIATGLEDNPRGRALTLLGHSRAAQGRKTEAAEVLSEGATLLRQSGNIEAAADALRSLATVHLALNRRSEGMRVLEEVLISAQERGQLPIQAVVLINLGFLKRVKGLLDAAEADLRRAMALMEKAPRSNLMAQAHSNLSIVLLLKGRLDHAHAHASAALELLHSSGRKKALAAVYIDLALIETFRGRRADAESALNHAEETERAADAASTLLDASFVRLLWLLESGRREEASLQWKSISEKLTSIGELLKVDAHKGTLRVFCDSRGLDDLT